jgi:hypothetical protein
MVTSVSLPDPIVAAAPHADLQDTLSPNASFAGSSLAVRRPPHLTIAIHAGSSAISSPSGVR